MAATSPPHSGRQFGQGEDDEVYGHRKNSSSQDSRQNFSYPNAYSQSPPLGNSSRSPDEFVTPSSKFPNETGGYPFSESYSSSSGAVLSDRAVNRFDNPRSKNTAEYNKQNGYGEYVNDMQRPQKGSYPSAEGGNRATRKPSQTRLYTAEDDRSNWIHRDKLTAIEIQEHIDLGREVPPELLRKMEERQRRNRHYRPSPSMDQSDHYNENKKPRLKSPSPDEYRYNDNYEDDDDPFVPEDPRSPEEIAAEWESPQYSMYQQHRLRSSSSRIPLSTSSPLPVPQEHLDRSHPLARKRSVSMSNQQDPIAYPQARSRSQSVGSQVLLDEEGEIIPNTPGSPSKARIPAKSTPTGRKGSSAARSTSVSATKNRNASATRTASAARPVTRDGRPTTATGRPEGEPPWLATMYKPDPRLPPDQQMLPTHAKRLAQEQWEKEGKSGQVFDREFRPTAVFPPRDNSPVGPAPELKAEDTQNGVWPQQREATPEPQRLQLSPQLTQGSFRNQQNQRIGRQSPQVGQQSPQKTQSNGELHGGYSITPRIQGTPVLGVSSNPPPDNRENFQVEESKAKDEGKRGGCGCCIVM